MTGSTAATPDAPAFAVGLTGGIGCGKSTVADLFAERGASIVDTDLIAHRLTAPGGAAIDAIRAAFGPAFIDADGAMDRAAMRARVFDMPEERKRLEAILHPMIRAETAREAAAATGAYVIFVVPLLVESGGWRERVDRILVIDCPEQVQVERVMRRSGLSAARVHDIMAAQVPRATRLAAADDVILNEAGIDALVPQVDRLHALYSSLAKSAPQT